MANVGDLVISISTDKKGLNKDLKGVEKSVGKTAKGLSKFGKIAGGVALGGVAALGGALVGLASITKESIELAGIQQDAEKQLEAVLKSTGGQAGLTAKELKGMASELQNVSIFGDEAIIASQSLLLTFTNIGSEIFGRTEQAILDVSQAMGQDLKTSTIQLGKALNDPLAGLGALSRVGIQFTDVQKELIESMVEVGNVTGAQSIILDELEKQFGGSALAATETYTGRMQQLANATGDLQEAFGAALLPVLSEFAIQALPQVNQAIVDLTPVFEQFGEFLIEFLPTAIELIKEVIPLFIAFGESLGTVSTFAKNTDKTLRSLTNGLVGNVDILKAIFEATAFGGIGGVVSAFENLPSFATGGIVPGSGPQLIVAHGGERVVPQGGDTNTNNVFIDGINAGSGEGGVNEAISLTLQALRRALSDN